MLLRKYINIFLHIKYTCILCKNIRNFIYICTYVCLVTLMIVKSGHIVTKLFDLFTFLFTLGFIYLMYKYFDSISILKPNNFRTTNSERYLM